MRYNPFSVAALVGRLGAYDKVAIRVRQECPGIHPLLRTLLQKVSYQDQAFNKAPHLIMWKSVLRTDKGSEKMRSLWGA
jgi:hypothetical protein